MTSEYSCTFCGLNKHQVKILVGGNDNNCYICDNCVSKCHDLISSKTSNQNEVEFIPDEGDEVPIPRVIKEFLDDYVVGQEDAKKLISVAAYNHYKRIENPTINGVELDKSNLLLAGPTASGKTLLVQSLARCLNVPWVIADATGLTEAGYIGEDVESIVGRLIANANYDIEEAQRGIVFIDEIDKKRVTKSSSGQRDVSGEGVQQALLKMIEGAELMVTPTGRKERVKINTRNILFIVSGAFVGLDKIINAKSPRIGFGTKQDDVPAMDSIDMAEHLIQYGLIPELVGRLPVHAFLKELTEEQLCHILTEPKNAITKQFEALFGLDDVTLKFAPDALPAIARKVIANKVGARGLRGLIEKALINIQYNLPDLRAQGVVEIICHAGVFTNSEAPEMIYEDKDIDNHTNG